MTDLQVVNAKAFGVISNPSLEIAVNGTIGKDIDKTSYHVAVANEAFRRMVQSELEKYYYSFVCCYHVGEWLEHIKAEYGHAISNRTDASAKASSKKVQELAKVAFPDIPFASVKHAKSLYNLIVSKRWVAWDKKSKTYVLSLPDDFEKVITTNFATSTLSNNAWLAPLAKKANATYKAKTAQKALNKLADGFKKELEKAKPSLVKGTNLSKLTEATEHDPASVKVGSKVVTLTPKQYETLADMETLKGVGVSYYKDTMKATSVQTKATDKANAKQSTFDYHKEQILRLISVASDRPAETCGISDKDLNQIAKAIRDLKAIRKASK